MDNLKKLFSLEEIHEKIRELAERIDQDYDEEPLVFIGTLKGAFIFLADLLKYIKNPRIEVDFVRLKSYGMSDTSSGKVEITKDVEIPLEGKHVIVVEDIVDTGLTLEFLLNHLKRYNPKSIKTCALIDKKERREKEVPIDYVGFKVDRGFLVGYGLDFAEKYRHLPGVYEVVKNE
jgi:hypoxanthine phosphoribosyltransferase